MKTSKHLKIPLLLLGLMIFISFGLGAASAATPGDNSTMYVSTTGNDIWDGQSTTYNSTTGSGPKATIKNATGTVTTGGNVYIANGIYNESNIIIDKNMNIVGESQSGTIINGQKSGNSIFTIASGVTVTITNLTLTNATTIDGGAIFNDHGTLTVRNIKFTNNTVNEYGGAIFNNVGSLTVENSTFTNNIANVDGGAIYNNGGSLTVENSTFTGNAANNGGAISKNDGDMTVENSTFTNNIATAGGAICNNSGSSTVENSTFTGNTANYGGGAIFNYNSSLTVENSTFTDNAALNGGAIYNEGILDIDSSNFSGNTATAIGTGTGGGAIYNDGAILNINKSEFTGNAATDNAGGAIYSYSGTTITVSNSKFTQNTSKTGGGAIRNNGSGTTLTVSNSKFTRNHAEYGGAICNSGIANITNSNFTDNNVTNAGGAICNDQGTLNVNNSTFTNNTAQEKGGVLYNYLSGNSNSTITVTNSTFTGNTAPNGGIFHNSGGNATISFSGIINNGSNEIYNDHGMVDARYNWWGSNDNPSNHVSNDVNVSPWLVLTVTNDNSSILIGGKSIVTADLQHDSKGGYHDPVNGHVPDGTVVTFNLLNTRLGSLNTISTTLTNGTAITMFTAANSGNENVTATIDNQLESTLIIINKSNNNNNTNGNNIPSTVNAATQTISMQHTGAPLAGLALAILAIFSGMLPRRKQ
ncbi:beta strand repeat-containing protein [Methanobacterium paludis]|uniref:Polymorphic outer membrane protein n=1 Tax=Methanobacterium paludis (strain DSM 25820 / JCM 18151 / SWAN1) TaxID=868131 RepID=F6D6R1_METPW|nr:right-handed parallel beta-helix repeat-containing protein [Methanobacterium paludis]AEG18344.1 polymorphic outer membrane protein [Methanobacterium paludis]